MVPTQEQVDMTLSLVVKRLGQLPGVRNHIQKFMTQPMLEFHNCTPMQYIYLGLGQIVLNYIDDLKEKQNVSIMR